MITNDKQYRSTRIVLHGLEEALDEIKSEAAPEDPIIHQAMLDSIQSEIEVLRKDIAKYKAIQSGDLAELQVDFDDLGEALALARVVAGLRQADLAERVGVQAQQIQRYEAADYEQASYARLKEIVWALGVKIRIYVPLPHPARVADVQQVSPSKVA